MNYYESVVIEYLRADRALFLNTQCCIQLNEGKNPDTSGLHWYCDAVATDFRRKSVFLCEISYSAQLSDMLRRLKGWHDSWELICKALIRDSALPVDWPMRPWLFVPEDRLGHLNSWYEGITRGGVTAKFAPLVTTLEMVQPWRYCSWNRVGENGKPDTVPEVMRA